MVEHSAGMNKSHILW